MKACPLRREDRRRGVALIIVLGFLSIMIMMAVAFITQARTERMVAGASLEGMRTRQMAQTAIAAAMQDYLNALKDVPPSETKHDIFLSGDGSGTLNFYFSGQTIGDDRLLVGKVEDWLLEEHLTAALGGDANDGVRNAEWIWVRQQPGTRSRILGRYAYACFDMSGLLDANLLGTAYGGTGPDLYANGGDPTNRNNVRKMLFDAIKPQSGYADQYKLSIHQDRWKGFDTPAALLNLTDGNWNDGRNQGANRWLGTDMPEGEKIDTSTLSAYSYSVLHLGAEAAGNLKVLFDATSIDKWGGADFVSILRATSAGETIKALQDYESTADAPVDVNYPSVKNVPMFNEIGIRAGLEKTGPDVIDTNGVSMSTYDLKVYLKAEFWYPFPSKENERPDSYKLEPSIGGNRERSGKADIWVQLQGLSAVEGKIELEAYGVGNAMTVRAKFNNNQPYFSEDGSEIVFSTPLTRVGGETKLPSDMQLRVGYIQIDKKHPLYLKTLTGTRVDSTPNDVDYPEFIAFFFNPAVVLPAGGKTDETSSWEVSDPRLNHRGSSWDQVDSPSWGAINGTTLGARNKATSDMGYEPGKYFYCRNMPMHSPAELGYIPTIVPWETLDIFSEKGIRLMNRAVCDQATYDLLKDNKAFFTNGTINPYTRHTNVLNAAFWGVDVEEVPGMDVPIVSRKRLSGGELDGMVKEIMKTETKNGYAGWASVLANNSILADYNQNNRIAVLSDTWGLFNESDRLFVVVVIAQSIKEGEGDAGVGNWDPNADMITGERRAVALCWMDASAEGSADTLSQEMNVIMFQYLNE